MSDLFQTVQDLGDDPEQLLTQLQETLRAEGRLAELFDVLQLRGRHELGLPLVGNLVLEQLPEETRDEVARRYREDCRMIGSLFLERGEIAEAWSYFGTIRELDPISEALEGYSHTPESDADQTEELIKIGFGQGVNPVAGYRLLLEHSGTCEGISIIERGVPYAPQIKVNCIELLTRQLHRELRFGLRQELTSAGQPVTEETSLLRMILEHPEVFEGDRAHVDDAHLQAVIRFSVTASPESQTLARELCEYGVRLAESYQFSEEPPFQNFYTDYLMLLNGLTGHDAGGAIAHFTKKVDELEGKDDLFAAEFLVLVLHRGGQPDEALRRYQRHLEHAPRLFGVAPSLADLCQAAGDYSPLIEQARAQGSLTQYASAFLAQRSDNAPS